MSENFESRFQQELRRRTRIRNIIYFMLVVLTIIIIYLLNQEQTIEQFFLITVVLVLIVALVFYLNQKRIKDYLSNYSNNETIKLPKIKHKHLLGLTLLIAGLTYQAYPHPLDNLIVGLLKNPTPPREDSPWPWNEHKIISPIVANLPENVETSIQSVAEYIAEKEPNPYLQVKALHDYVVDRVTYDSEVLQTGKRPKQDAQTVFHTHKAVCEGYAKLFQALGRSIGLDVAYIEGKVRRDSVPLEVISETLKFIKGKYDWTLHAWNAVKIGDSWQLVDTTWDSSSNPSFPYRSDYLMLPPETMILSHFPHLDNWQLSDSSINHNTFERKPILTPQFFAEGLELIAPTEYKTNVQTNAVVEIKSSPNYNKKIIAGFTKLPKEKFLIWRWLGKNKSTKTKQDPVPCNTQTNAGGTSKISCHFPESGDYQVVIFSSFGNKQHSLGKLKFHVF